MNDRDSDFEEVNWYEIKITGKQPERRAYHSSFEYQNKLYVFGGNDIIEGLTDSLWMLDLNDPNNDHDKVFENKMHDPWDNSVLTHCWNPIKTAGTNRPSK